MTAPWCSPEYALDWPGELVVSELHELLNAPYWTWSPAQVELLLREAFHTGAPADDYARLAATGLWTDNLSHADRWLSDLARNLDELRPFRPAAPYWGSRRTGSTLEQPRPSARVEFARLVESLRADGYLDRDFSEPCPVEDPEQHWGKDLNLELHERLGDTDRSVRRWPLQPQDWSEDEFYSLVEIFHDLVARPRSRWDDDDGQDVHFSDYDPAAGRRVYTTLVNRLFDEHTLGLRLSTADEDLGRLVHVAAQGLDDLAEKALTTPAPGPASEIDTAIRHAVARFRAREASTEDKRSAVVTLCGVIEARIQVIKSSPHLTTKDESDLFNIANNFALRHQDIKQKRDYDPIFLDWMFWWLLAAIQVTSDVLARAGTGEPAAS